MTQSPSPKTKTTNKPRSAAILLLRTAGDTTWRMFVPTIGLTVLGVAADNYFGSKPWGTTVGIIVGSALATFLIRAQLKKTSL